MLGRGTEEIKIWVPCYCWYFNELENLFGYRHLKTVFNVDFVVTIEAALETLFLRDQDAYFSISNFFFI